MSVLTSVPQITAVVIKGLDGLSLPFVNHLIDGNESDLRPKGFEVSDNDKYLVKSITGLEPPDRDVALAATASGGKFQGVIVHDREIVVLIGLNPDRSKGETPQFLRDNLYTMLYTGYDPKVDFQFIQGIFPVFHEYAYVSKFEAVLFDKDPVVQITFTCLNPTFRALTSTSYDPADLSEKAPDVYNHGTAETGFQFAVKFTGTMAGWYIKQADRQSVGMVFDMTFHDGDVLAVSTIPGNRYVHWNKHRGKVQNKLGILKSNPEWIQLHPGHNHFLVPKKTSVWDWKGKLTFTAKYAGV